MKRPFPRHERDRERAARRQENFSDIVIGFSLAEIGLSLVMPAHAIDFVTHLAPLFAFIVTFATVVRYWRVSDVIFESFFEPSPLATALNFVALACLILQIFSLQLYLHFVPTNEGVVASRIYFGFFSLTYGVQGLLMALGGTLRWNVLSRAGRRLWVRLLLGRLGLVAGTIVGNVRATTEQAKIYMTPMVSLHDLQAHYKPQSSALVANFPISIAVDGFLGVAIGIAASYVLSRTLPALRERTVARTQNAEMKESTMPDDDPEFELCAAQALLTSLSSLLAHKPPDDTLTKMAGSMGKLLDTLKSLGEEPLPPNLKARQAGLFAEGTALSAKIRSRVVVLNQQYAGETKPATVDVRDGTT